MSPTTTTNLQPTTTNKPELFIIAHDIRSLYNVGSLFRLADGVGVSRLYLTGLTGAPHDRLKYQRQRQQIAKTALEGLDAVDWTHQLDPLPLIQELKERGVTMIGLEITKASQDLSSYQPSGPQCLIIGNEVEGIPQNILQHCDATLHLPMRGKGKSLNVITATAASLYILAYKQQQLL